MAGEKVVMLLLRYITTKPTAPYTLVGGNKCKLQETIGESVDDQKVCAGAEGNSDGQPGNGELPLEAEPEGEARNHNAAEGAADINGPDEEVRGKGSAEKAPAVRRRQVNPYAVGRQDH